MFYRKNKRFAKNFAAKAFELSFKIITVRPRFFKSPVTFIDNPKLQMVTVPPVSLQNFAFGGNATVMERV
jgi:hypothetical protein